MKIYMVMGHRGEYSDYSTWPIKAFKDKDKAVALVAAVDEKIQIRKEKLKIHWEKQSGLEWSDPRRAEANKEYKEWLEKLWGDLPDSVNDTEYTPSIEEVEYEE